MTQSLEKYIESGEPILVLTENNLLVPYELEERDLTGKSSAINHQTPNLFRSCLVRIPGEPFNPNDFIKISKDRIYHLGLNQWFDEKVVNLPRATKYIYQRFAAEVACEITGDDIPFKKFSDLTSEELKQEIANLPPETRIDLAFQTLKNLCYGAKDDILGEIERNYGGDYRRTSLYEIIFDRGINPGVDIYMKK